MLKAQRKEALADERNQALLDAGAAWGASRFGVQGIDAQVEYESKFSFDVGVSFWVLAGAQILVNGGFYLAIRLLKLPEWAYSFNGILGLMLVVYLIKRLK